MLKKLKTARVVVRENTSIVGGGGSLDIATTVVTPTHSEAVVCKYSDSLASRDGLTIHLIT